MKGHRFDPFSFLFGAVFLTVGCSFLFGSPGVTGARPFRAWPAAVVVVGLVLVAWAVARAVRPPAAGAPASPSPGIDDVPVEGPLGGPFEAEADGEPDARDDDPNDLSP